MSIAYYNGKICEVSEVAVPLTDRAVFFGDGIYDAAIGRGGVIYLEDEHIDRFIGNANKMGIPLPFGREELVRLLRELVMRSGEEVFFLYFQLSRYSEKRRHACPERERANLLITVTDTPLPDPKRQLSLVSYPDKRYEYCHIKTLNLLPAVLASSFAERMGADEAVFHRGEVVTECAHSNISILRGDVLITHPTDTHILPGIARKKTIEICKEMGVKVEQRPFTREELLRADAALVTSSSKLCLMARCVDGVSLGARGRKIGEEICAGFFDDFMAKTGGK
jgi:D-alanine transaminase